MKRTLIALFAAAALAIPAAAQQQNPDPNTSQNKNSSQDQSGSQDSANQSEPSMSGQRSRSGSIHLTRAQTRMLQQSLNTQGLNAGPVDGVMGSKTKEALKKYQGQKGLNASGEIDRQTLATLLSQKGGTAGASPGNQRTASQKGSGHGMPSQHHNQGQQGSPHY